MMTLAALEARPVAACTAEEVSAALNASFQHYVVPVSTTAEAYERRFRSEHLDPFASRVYRHDGRLAGVMLITRRGWTSRVGAFGLTPEFRGKGLGRIVMAATIDAARERGDRAMLLEVFESNLPAVTLYTRLGFRATRRLFGYEWSPASAAGHDVPEPMDPLAFARVVAQEGEPELPYMLKPETLSASAHPHTAWRLGDQVFALTTDPDGPVVVVRGLVVRRDARRRGWGRRMLQALATRFPGRKWYFPQVVPEDLAPGFFTATGWTRSDLNQLDMRLGLG